MKLRNRIMTAVMAIVASMTFIGATAFAADGAVSLKASNTTVNPGETFTLEVYLDENPGTCAVGYKINAKNAAFDLTGAVDSKLLAGSQLSKTFNKEDYKMLWIMDDMYETDYDDTGLIATLTYTVKADAAPGAYTINIWNDGSDNCAMEEPDMGSSSITITVAGGSKAAELNVEKADNKAEKAEGEAYTQGFKVTVTPNDDTVNGVDFTLTTSEGKEKAYTGAAAFQFDAFTGASSIVLGLNVKEVPATATVDAEFAPVVVAE